MRRPLVFLAGLLICAIALSTRGEDGNKLSYLHAPLDPYYVHRDFPKLTTPQWVGEDGVQAVVVLGIDDMRDPAKYEAYLRPILDRLKQIDGRAPVSIMTNRIDPQDPTLQTWLQEGVSLETHTIDHPCPCLAAGDLAAAKSTYDRCVDLMHRIPGNRPVAFRMPCCDSKNTPSPRFWTEIFNKTTPQENYLSIDSSVFNITTSRDPDLPSRIVVDGSGQPRFRKYLPFPSFVNTIEDYPYPYVIGDRCWEFPCAVPSDWEAQNLHQPNNPRTVEDLKAALDAVVIKQGVYNLVFHPHGWIRSDQVVEFIDYAVQAHGPAVKFLNFREALDRINQNLLEGHPLRAPSGDHRVQLLDMNHDGFLDVFVQRAQQAICRTWDPRQQTWSTTRQAWPYDDIRFALTPSDVAATALAVSAEGGFVRLSFDGDRWAEQPTHVDVSGAAAHWRSACRQPQQLDSYELHDFDRNGIYEAVLAKNGQTLILTSTERDPTLRPLPWSLPAPLVTAHGGDAGLRLVDVDADGFDDCVHSDGTSYSVRLFESMETGWSKDVLSGRRDRANQDGPTIPMIVRRDGTNNGAWFHSGHLWIQNEDTDRMADGVDRLALREMLGKAYEPPNPKWGGWPGPQSPESSRVALHAPPGVKVELVASEPLIVDPIAFDWGPDGRLWVVEMRGYPNGMDGQGAPGGRIKVLDDVDQDGRYDRATVFLDKLSFPTGIKVWRNGVLVTVAPEIIYAEDTDGDGVADRRETLYRGFREGNQQHRVNGLRFGVDGWLYLANGDSGGEIESTKTGQKVSIRGRDLRIRPGDGGLEAITGRTQFGRNPDDFGNWFGGNNSDPMWHFVLEDRYQKRNPHYAAPQARKQVPIRPGPAPVFPRSDTIERFNDFDRANRFTSACSPMVYRDHLLGEEDTHYSFVCEPVHNLVHREILRAEGPSFTSQRSPELQRSEFLASSDNWFRPVMVRTGPDGALWVADMYRLVIEHPEWIPAAWQAKLDLRAGEDKGRIYRVRDSTRGKGLHLRPVPRLDRMSTRQLVQALDQANGTQRDMAHQLLIWRNDPEAVEPLKSMATHARWPQASIHALYLLDTMKALTEELVANRIRHADSSVGRHAMRLGEPFLPNRTFDSRHASSADPASLVGEAILARRSPDMAWDLQAAYTLGYWPDRRAAERLAETACRYPDDPYLTAAVMSSLTPDNIHAVVQHAHTLVASDAQRTVFAEFLRQAIVLGGNDLRQLAFRALNASTDAKDTWRFRTLGRLIQALPREEQDLTGLSAETRDAVHELLRRARQSATSDSASPELRVAAVELLGREANRRAEDFATLHTLVAPRHPPAIQLAALDVLQRLDDPQTPIRLMQSLPTYSPRVRARIMDMVLARDAWAIAAMRALGRQDISQDLFDARRRQQLLSHAKPEIQKLAAKYFSGSAATSRAEVVARFADIDASRGNRERGELVFKRVCATCHRWGQMGHAVGPDLAALSHKGTEALLTQILDPNRALQAPYVDYVIVTANGLRYSGIVAAETSSSVTLLGPDGKQQTVLRKDIDLFQSTGRSLMPEGLEKDLTREELTDLLHLLGSRPEAPKHFPGNEPRPAPVRDDGSIRCFAVHAEIYGPSLVFEPRHSHLGLWQDVGDRAVWLLQPKRPGKFRVAIDYACDDATAGNSFLITVGEQTLGGQVEATGSWDQYRRRTVGVLDLPADQSQLIFRSAGPIQGFLLDLRTIYLEPE